MEDGDVKERTENIRNLTDGVAQPLSVESPGHKLTLHQRPNLRLRTQRGHLQDQDRGDRWSMNEHRGVRGRSDETVSLSLCE